ncbi:MAG TPA: orotate phosphoribosyltransferase [Alphaproteobacteria bacterium]|nr:orotate phosphoribosyltransferase [Alphaproteobacteria bacterium]
MDKKEIAKQTAKILLDTKSILINTKNPFTYTSGKIGPTYADMRRMISFPNERKILMDFAAEIIRPLNIDYVAGGETAGIPYAAFLSERLNLPMLYVRKKPKGHGRMAQIEGHIEGENKKVILVEDLLTVGSSQKVFVQALREAGLIIENSFVIFSYGIYPESKENLAEMKINLHSLTTWWDILECVKEENYFDAETISSFESFLHAPNEWEQNFKQKAS